MSVSSLTVFGIFFVGLGVGTIGGQGLTKNDSIIALIIWMSIATICIFTNEFLEIKYRKVKA